MAKNHKIPKCPPLRFPDFNDEWTQTTLGEIAEILNSRRKPITSSDRVRGDYPYYGASGIIDYVNEYIFDEQLLLIGEDGAKWGKDEKTAFIVNGRCWVNNHAHVLRFQNYPTYKLIEAFFFSLNLKPFVTGDAPPKLTLENLKSILIHFPSLAEQEKIAGFLSLIDERIQSCSETIKEIKTLKAGLLSLRVYQADKQYVPLSYFGEMKHGYPFKSTSYDEDGTHRIVTISNVSGARYADMSKCNYLAELPHDIQQHQILSRNDILISLTGNVGRVSFCLADGDLLNQRVGVLSLCDEAYKEYIYQVLSDWRFEMSMVACGQGAAQLNISKSNVEGYLVPYEQSEYQEIGNFFSLLDDRIEIEEALLKQYEMQKKYLLRQMFI